MTVTWTRQSPKTTAQVGVTITSLVWKLQTLQDFELRSRDPGLRLWDWKELGWGGEVRARI